MGENTSRTTILMTAEENNLLGHQFGIKGTYGRTFPMYVEGDDLFDDVQEIEQCRVSAKRVGWCGICYFSK